MLNIQAQVNILENMKAINCKKERIKRRIEVDQGNLNPNKAKKYNNGYLKKISKKSIH